MNTMQMRHIDIAMKDNHCLRVAEIVQMVVDEVSGSADLAHLARASRSFQEPALNKLWKTVVGLRPLLRTLPSDLYTEMQIWPAPGQVRMPRKRKNTMAIAVCPVVLGLLRPY